MQEKKKCLLKVIFVGILTIFSVICFAILNNNYDILSRYPYTDQKSRDLIKKYLAKPEIDYIIEYSIAPNVFISFIQEKGFNIYHASDYKHLSEIAWDQSPSKIVEIIEKARNRYTIEDLIAYLNHYSFGELYDWVINGDRYQPEAELLANAASLDAYIDDYHSIGIRVPYHLQKLQIGQSEGNEIYLDESAIMPLMNLFYAIDTSISHSNGHGGLEVLDGYISYQNQEQRYQSDTTKYEIPGHCDNQLGLSVDFAVDGIMNDYFSLTEQAQWLMEHAHEYGFVLLDKQKSENHYRYIGVELANQLFVQKMDFKNYHMMTK